MKRASFVATILILIGVIVWFALQPREQVFPSSAIETPTFHNLTTIKSNQWYSSIYKGLPTSPLFALPLAFQFTDAGLGFSYPKIVAEPNTIFASYARDFSVGIPAPLTTIKIDQVGDWHIKTTASSDQGTMTATLAHGVPYVHLASAQGIWKIAAQDTFEISDQTPKSLVLTTHENNYVLVWKDPANVTVSSTEIRIDGSPQLYVALLDDVSHAQLFIDQADVPLLGTLAQWHIQPTTIETHYAFNAPQPSLFTLYPHQKASLVNPPEVLGEYHSIRGPLSLVHATGFTTSISKTTPADIFAPLTIGADIVKKTLESDEKELTKAVPESKSYGLSVWMGKVANLIELSDTVQAESSKHQLLATAEATLVELGNWHTYDATQYSYISKQPEYGNERLNDHHFHYGYPIRLAAILVKFQPESREKVENTINNLVADIATDDRQSDTYPFLRNFDIYEGHSWADGYAKFDDGNNQESSSEAINAWYSVYLWATQTKNTALRDTALYLYNTEIASTKYYWFNTGNVYPAPYAHAIASLVWGGKVDFTTWFGDVTNFKYGIQLLPLTPASDYLKTIPNFFNYEADFTRSGGDFKAPWGELMLVWKSYTSPDVAVSDLPKNSEISPLSVLQYLIYSHTTPATIR